jgi:hypothetical protein
MFMGSSPMTASRVIAHGLRAAGSLAGDALGDLSGRGLTLDEAQLVRADYLTDLVNRFAVPPASPVRIEAVRRRPLHIESTNCRNMLIDIEQPENANGLPTSLFLKMPEQALATRWFFNVINAWQLECHFCRHIAPLVPLRTPTTYAVAQAGSRFVLVQENLGADPAVTLHTNRNLLAGPDLELARRCLDGFARLHAGFAGKSSAEREAILPAAMHIFLAEPQRSVSRALNRFGLAPCLRKAPGVIPDALQQTYRDVVGHWQRALDWWFDGSLTLLHGDSHLGNFFIDGDGVGMLDFQAVHWGKGMRDVQYFLIDSLPAEVLAQNERDLIAYYCERRAAYGAPLAVEVAWMQYAGFAFQALMTIVVSIGLGAMNDRAETMVEVLRRTVAACLRLDVGDWGRRLLAGTLPPVGPA